LFNHFAGMYFDVIMPVTLFLVTLASMLLNKKAENKLKGTFEEREFGIRDAVLLVVSISVIVSIIVFIPRLAIMTLFLFSYSMLLFIFTYLFSDFDKYVARFLLVAFLGISLVAGWISLTGSGLNGTAIYGTLTFFGLAGLTLLALMYEETRMRKGERVYLAVLPPALFICLYLFFNRTPIWFPYLLNIYGVAFAILITIYLGSLFTWETSLIFCGLLTIMDIILVLFTGTMISAAKQVTGLMLPVLVTMPTIPAILFQGGRLYMSLGLGDFFFAGLIAVQTYKKYGRRFAVLSTIAMCTSFFIFETYLLSYDLRAFPGTLMIISGWIAALLLRAGLGEIKNILHLTFQSESHSSMQK
jgi:hypothetical protein